ncbi:MAG: SUMF1/EgtB/PvdO family nonheme iron enzyme [Planctomycetota bacterium]
MTSAVADSSRGIRPSSLWFLALVAGMLVGSAAFAAEEGKKAVAFDPNDWEAPKWLRLGKESPANPIAEAEAKDQAGMKPYSEVIAGADVTFDMVPIPAGKFVMGSPAGEKDRGDDEGPQVEVETEPFWMGKCEVTWDEYDAWAIKLDIQRRKLGRDREGGEVSNWDKLVDAMARPTNAYTDMTFGMGHDGYPAICMTQYAAKMYCKWLCASTGRYYRLPTEAEWEYACRAGTTTTYSFGDDPDELDDYAWHFDNSDDQYQKVGKKKPNPWGLYDMHGNVSEWVLDQHVPDFYQSHPSNPARNPFAIPTTEFPRVVRGGSWDDDPNRLRSAARRGSTIDWKMQDPQIPQSIWFLTDGDFLGFRVVRPLRTPTAEEAKLYEPDPEVMKEYRIAQGGKQ